MWTEYIPIANFVINLIIIPLVKILWDIRGELIKINGRINLLEHRIVKIEDEISELR